MPIIYFIPVSMKALNQNIDGDLVLTDYFGTIRKSTDNTFLKLLSGATDAGSPNIQMISSTYGISALGEIWVYLKSGNAVFACIQDIHLRTALSLRGNPITNLGAPIDLTDAAPKNYVDGKFPAWSAWTPTLVWTTGTPSGINTTARYVKIGKIVFFEFTIVSADSNGCSDLTISLPVSCVATSIYCNFPCYESNSVIWTNPLGYIDTDNSLLKFRTFSTVLDGNGVRVEGQGFYEVA